MGSTSLLRAAVLAVALLLLADTGEAFFDLFSIFRPRSDSDYFPFDGSPEQAKRKPKIEQEEDGAAPATATGLTKVPPLGAPSKAALDTIVLPVDDSAGHAGSWTIVSENSGVSAMHLAVMRHGKAIMFDTSTTGRSLMRLPMNNCRADPRAKREGTMDCWAHAVEFDYSTGALRSLKTATDTWCSSGAFDADGNLIQTGGYFEGDKAVRRLDACDTCDWREYPNSFAEGRWYATQQVLPDGRFIVFGGRRAFSYEFVPQPGMTNGQSIKFPLLRETTDDVENNLYPFVNLLPDGNLFVFANDRSVVFDHRTGKVVRELPKLAGGGRNHPASAMSAMLPLDLRNLTRGADPEPEVIVCGGALKTAFRLGENNTYQPTLRDCARINLGKIDAVWAVEAMPVGRVMGDLLVLPTGDLLMLNGAAKGSSGWGFARQPILSPILYSPRHPEGSRFRPLAASTVARMYHSSSAVLPDATVLVAGGNTNAAYNFSGVDFPTEVRVERFAPPYLSRELTGNRAVIDVASVPAGGMRYGTKFTFRFHTPVAAVVEGDVRVTMYAPPFTTHGYSMNQRLLVLPVAGFSAQGQMYELTVDTPRKPELAPPGYYLVYVVAKDVPSVAAWVKIQ
uniref:Galactose oxidase-like Early set domain-containing protein n=1 Tax=Oryza meridionalis TaxID=40149 RepID=A0A0E0DUP9_9ORYZ